MPAILFSSTFILIGLGVSIWGFKLLRRAQATRSWPTTSGIVNSSQVGEWQDSDGDDLYGAMVEYGYTVGDASHRAHQICLGQSQSSIRATHEKLVARYPVGESVTVYYDPECPSEAVLEPGVRFGACLPLLFGVCMTGFASFMLWGFTTLE